MLAVASTLDLAPGPGGSQIVPVAIDRLPAVLAMFDGVYAAAVVALYPSAQIVGHRDAPIEGARWHVPLRTNDGCWSHHGGEWIQLEVGRCYRMDPAVFHGAVNWGEDVRWHLTFDRKAR